MAEEKYEVFINKILQKTKEGALVWRYLDEKEALYTHMGWVPKAKNIAEALGASLIAKQFDRENSFYCSIDNFYIVLYAEKDELIPCLCVIPETFKAVTYLSADDYGDQIVRLSNYVKSLFPSSKAFIDAFLKEN